MRIPDFLSKHSAVPTLLYGFSNNTLQDDDDQPSSKPWLYILLTIVLCSLTYYHLVLNRAMVELELTTNVKTMLKFYWPDHADNFSERRVAQLLIKPGKTKYKLRVTDISDLEYLRFDPCQKLGQITVKRLTIKQNGYPAFTLQTGDDFNNLEVIDGIDSVVRDDRGISFHADTRDPKFKLYLPKMEKRSLGTHDFGHGITLFLLAIGCFSLARIFFQTTDFIPMSGAFVLALLLVMASISGFNTHPDESVHVAAGKYYRTHTLPPKVMSPEIEHTYSHYGVSRLHSGEIVYLMVGKFQQLIQAFHLPSYLGMRFFNVLLFSALVIVSLYKVNFRFFLLPLLLSPQVWYVFSYFNSDALSTFVSLIAAYQLAVEKSALNVLLRGGYEHKKHSWTAACLLGILFGLLLLQKMNFYFLYVFFLFYFIWKLWMDGRRWTRKTVYRFCAVVLIGASLFAAFRGVDSWVNDFNKKELIFEARKKYAKELYNPNTPIDKLHAYLYMKERGKTLRQLFQQDRFGEKLFRSSFGVYGYTQYSGSFSYYNNVRAIALLLLLSLLLSIIRRGGLSGNILMTFSMGWAFFLFAGLVHHAWTGDFQAQGRYLLPVLPMFAILFYHAQRILIKPLFYTLFFLLFSFSMYNFIFVGLREIGKVAG